MIQPFVPLATAKRSLVHFLMVERRTSVKVKLRAANVDGAMEWICLPIELPADTLNLGVPWRTEGNGMLDGWRLPR